MSISSIGFKDFPLAVQTNILNKLKKEDEYNKTRFNELMPFATRFSPASTLDQTILGRFRITCQDGGKITEFVWRELKIEDKLNLSYGDLTKNVKAEDLAFWNYQLSTALRIFAAFPRVDLKELKFYEDFINFYKNGLFKQFPSLEEIFSVLKDQYKARAENPKSPLSSVIKNLLTVEEKSSGECFLRGLIALELGYTKRAREWMSQALLYKETMCETTFTTIREEVISFIDGLAQDLCGFLNLHTASRNGEVILNLACELAQQGSYELINKRELYIGIPEEILNQLYTDYLFPQIAYLLAEETRDMSKKETLYGELFEKLRQGESLSEFIRKQDVFAKLVQTKMQLGKFNEAEALQNEFFPTYQQKDFSGRMTLDAAITEYNKKNYKESLDYITKLRDPFYVAPEFQIPNDGTPESQLLAFFSFNPVAEQLKMLLPLVKYGFADSTKKNEDYKSADEVYEKFFNDSRCKSQATATNFYQAIMLKVRFGSFNKADEIWSQFASKYPEDAKKYPKLRAYIDTRLLGHSL